MASVSVGGSVVKAGTQLLDEVRVGDYVLVHTGFAIQKLSEQEALETIQLIRELEAAAEGGLQRDDT